MQDKGKQADERRRAGKLPGLLSLSVLQLATRWKCTERDVNDAIKTGTLRAHVLMAGVPGRNAEGQRVTLEGHYSLSPEGARALLEMPPPNSNLLLHLVTPDGKQFTALRGHVRPSHIRVLLDEAERYEREHFGLQAETSGGADSKPLRPSQRARESVRAIAALLWQQEATCNLNIKQMIERPELTKCLELGGHHRGFTHDTIRGWIHDLCPDPKPGRPPKT